MHCRYHHDGVSSGKRICLLLHYLSGLILLLLLPLRIAMATQEDTSEFPHQVLVIALKINAQPIGTGVVALRTTEGDWLLPMTVLRAAHVVIPETPTLRFNEADYLSFAALGGTESTFDEQQQALDVRLNPSQFTPTQLTGDLRRGAADQSARPAGAFFNYDLTFDHTQNGTGYTLFSEIGAALGSGVGVSNFLFIDRPGLRESIRLDTTFTVDYTDRAASLRVGDTISRPPTPLGRPVRLAGLQWSTNFQTQPGLVTMPVATLSGQAALPSTIDLYVDNVLQARNPVPPGPFSISTPPLVAGDGEVLLKVTDLSGQQQLISQRFYASTVLLASGLSDYSFEIGALRRNYGLLSNDYGDALVSAGWRHGLTNSLTIEAGASLQQHGPAGLLAGASSAMAGVGIGSIAIGLSHDAAGSGMQIGLGFERRSAQHSFSARMQFASSGYRQSGVDPAQAIRRLNSLFYGYRIGDLGSIGLSFTRQQRMDAQAISIASASISSRQSAWGSLGLSLIRTQSDRSDTSLNLFWAMSLGRGTSISAFHAQTAQGDAQQIMNLQKNMEPGEGWGYRLQAARNAAQQASVYGQNAYGMGRIEVAELDSHTSLRAGLSGGVALLDGRGFLTRRIDGSFGLVRMPGFANVRVYVDNQLAGRTDADGFALLPRLYPYIKNNVSVEQLDVPLDAQIDTLRVSPVPAWRSGVLIDVPVRAASGATLDLNLDDGTPVPAGAAAILVLDDGKASDTFVVGHQGLLYLSGLRAENHLQVTWPAGECRAHLAYTPEKGSVPHLGPVVCERAGGR